MRAGGGGFGLEFPPGDPGAVEAGAGALDAAAARLSAAAGQVGSAAGTVVSAWQGPAASAFEEAVNSVRRGLDALAGHHREAADALRIYAVTLRDAQLAAERAGQAYGRAETQYGSTMSSLAANPPTGHGAKGALTLAESRAADSLHAAYLAASTSAAHACGDATHAAQVCAAKLSHLAEDIKATGLHKFLDLMAGPGALLGMLGVESQLQSGLKFWNVLSDMATGNWSSLETLDPAGYQRVLAAAARYGADSSQALEAQLRYEAEIADSSFGDMAQAATGIGRIPSGFAGAMDVLGKFGLVLGVTSDIGILVDSQSAGLDKGMAGANLAGIGLAAAGTDLGGTALALVGVDSVAAAVPVAGEVIIAGTAVFFAGEWVYAHWDDITHWADDVGGFVAGSYQDASHVVNAAVSEGEHLVSAGLHEAGQLASGALDEGKHLLADLNPF